MKKVFVNRDAGTIVAVFAREQAAGQEELLATDPEVVAFRSPTRPSAEQRDLKRNKAIIETIAEATGTAPAAIRAMYRSHR